MGRKEREIEHSSAIADQAVEFWGWSGPAGEVRGEKRANQVLKNAQIRPNQQVLEIGCGTGHFSAKFLRSGAQLTCTDLSASLVERMKCRPATVLVADAESLPFEDNRFDAVIGNSILHHVHLPTTVAEIHRVLRTGGTFAFAEPNLLNPQIAIQKNVAFVKRMMGESPDETAYTRWGYAKFFLDAGFAEVHAQPFDFLHPSTPALLVRSVNWMSNVLECIPLLKEFAGSIVVGGRK